MARAAYVTVRTDVVVLETPFSESFVTELKEKTTTRKWDPDLKIWTVDLSEKRAAIAIVRKHFGRAYLLEGAVTTDLRTGESREQATLF
ncbi:MAG: hypothetical protein RDU41_08350 [Clostridia bacterium]|nr:hypothetical protein [Clostridia bacterium]